MKYTAPLKKNYEFRRLYSRGKSAGTSRFTVYCRRNGTSGNRFGITVSTKIGKAVVRNKIRRRLREIYRLNEENLNRGYDIVIVARRKSRDSEYMQLNDDFVFLTKKLGIYR